MEGWGRTRAPWSAGAAHAVLLTSGLHVPRDAHLKGTSLSSDWGWELEDERDCGEGMGKLFKVHMLLCEWDMSS